MMTKKSAPVVMTERAFREFVEGMIEEVVHQCIKGQLSNVGRHAFARKIASTAFNMVMNRKQAAKFLGVSVRTLDRWVKHDGLPSDFRQIQKNRRPQRIFLLADTLDWQLQRVDRFWKPRRRR